MPLSSELAVSGDQYFWLLLTNLIAVFSMKMFLIVVAYFVIKMGFQLLVDGVKGEFKFKSNFSGVKADLASASPGTLFLLLGVVVLVFALTKKSEIPFSQDAESKTENTLGELKDVTDENPF